MKSSQNGCKVWGCVFGVLMAGACFAGMVLWARQAGQLLYARETVERADRLSAGLLRYVQENKRFPALKTSEDLKRALYPKYVADEAVFILPETRKPFTPNAYLDEKKLADIKKIESVVAIYDAEPHDPAQRVVGLLSGSGRYVTPQEWDIMQRDSHIP